MERFIYAINKTEALIFYKPGELTPSMYGKSVKIVGGYLNGYKGCLLSVKGKRKRRLIIEIPELMAADVEVEPDFIQFV